MLCHCLDDHAIARLSLTLCGELAAMGCDVSLVVTEKDAAASPTIPPGVAIVDLGLHASSTMAAVPALARWLRRARPDVLFAQHNGPNRAAVVARTLAHVPTHVITVEQNHYSSYMSPSGGGWKQRRVRDFLTRWIYPRANCVTGVSPEVVKDLEAHFHGVRGRTAVLPNPGPDPNQLARLEAPSSDVPWLASPRRWRVVTSVANVIPRKGQDVLVEALPEIRRRAGDVRLVFVGRIDNEAYHASLLRRAEELGVDAWIAFLGFREDRLSLLTASDVFALASRNEGAPLSILEAMACGVPVVAADCLSGPAYLLENGRCGRLVSVDDAPGFADALVEVLTKPETADRYVRAGRDRAAHFAPRRAAEAYLSLAHACLAGTCEERTRTVHAIEHQPI
jgi:glycosyltransferase involved in cell wall biosynthesis